MVTKIKSIHDNYHNNIEKPISEINDLELRGFKYIIEVNEKGPVPWRSIVGLGILATA